MGKYKAVGASNGRDIGIGYDGDLGIALLVLPNEQANANGREGAEAEEARAQDSLRVAPVLQMFQYASATDKICIVLGIFFSFLSALQKVAFLYLLGNTLTKLNGDTDSIMSSVNRNCMIFNYVGAGAFVAGVCQVYCWSRAGEEQAIRIRGLYVRAILRQDIGWFDENRASELPTVVTANMAKMQDGIGQKLGDAVMHIMGIVSLIILAFIMSPAVAAVVVVSIPITGAVTGFTSKLVTSSAQRESDCYAMAGGVATEILGGIRTVCSLTSEPAEIERYSSTLKTAEESGIQTGSLAGLGKGVMQFCFFCTYGAAFWVGGIVVARDIRNDCEHHCATGGKILTAVLAYLVCSLFVGQASTGLGLFMEARRAAVSVFAMIDSVPTIDSASEVGKTPSPVMGDIEFNNVSFAYPARRDSAVFKGLTLKIPRGTVCALVGPSGGGKSTMAKLLLRFYDPVSGAVRLDGVDIRELCVQHLRSVVGYVGQECVLFEGTVWQNIANGKPACTNEEVCSAAKKANAFDFITSFPEGFDTEVGEGGVQMSGGQKQRIAIARAIIRNPAVLILDESTSALDSHSEQVVQAALDDLRRTSSFTTLVIAHRLSTIKTADCIAVISDKCVAEQGTHEALRAAGGIYANLCPEWEEREQEEWSERRENTDSRLRTPSNPREELYRKRKRSLKDPEGASGDVKEDGGEVTEEGTNMSSGRLWALNQPERAFVYMGLLGALMAGSTFPCIGALIGLSEAAFYKNDPHEVRHGISMYAKLFLVVAIVALIGFTLLNRGMAVSGERLTHRLRDQSFTAIIRHDIEWFDVDEHSTALLTSRLENDAGKVQKATGKSIADTLQLMATLGIGILIGLVACWQVALVCALTVPLIAASATIQRASLRGKYGDNEGLDGGTDAARLLGTALTSMATVTAYNMQAALSAQYGELVAQASRQRQRRALISGVAFGYSQAILSWTAAAQYWVGGVLVANGTVSFRNFYIARMAAVFGSIGVASITTEWNGHEEGMQAAARLFKIIDEPLKIDPLSDEGAILPVSDLTSMSIQFRDVTFAYPSRPDVQVYKKMCLDVKAGTTVALCGPSGVGKSTCLALLLRFYDPLSGAVLLNGRDLRELNVRWLRRLIGYVGQEPILFSGTIRDNILRAKPTATQQEVEAAARSAHAHEFISAFPMQYLTEVGEKSSLVSGGQKQRIAIARALIKNPSILLLDEASSALDNESEEQVQIALDALQREQRRTTIVVAHKLSTIMNADLIAVFANGVVSEQGRHAELLSNPSGLYAALWKQQHLA